MNRGANRQDVFFSTGDRQRFLDLIGDAAVEGGIEIHAFCLMPNHFHLLVHCPEAGLARCMQQIGSRYTQYVNHRLDRDGALFRGRYRSIPIESEGSIRRVARYVHRNPKDLQGCDDLTDYRWSSLRAHLDPRLAPSWLRCDTVRALEGGIDLHQAFVTHDQPVPPPADPYDGAWAVDAALAESDRGWPPPSWLRRVVGLLVAEQLADTTGTLPPGIDDPCTVARRVERHRARRRYREDPAVRALVREAMALLR